MNPKRYIYIIISVIIVALVIIKFSSPAVVKVKKVSVTTTDVVKTVSASGFVKTTVEANLGFPVSGKIINIYKKEGDQVKQGDLLAQIYNEDLFYNAESARKRKDYSQKTRDIYVDNYEDIKDDVGGDKQYSLNIQKLTDDLRVYDNSYKSSLSTLKKTYLYAPFDGTITSIPFHVGEVAGATTTLKMSNLNVLQFQAELDQADYKFVKLTQDTEIALDAYPQEKFSGSVESVPSFVDEDSTTKTFKLLINLNNKDSKIVKGMTGDANIIVAKESGVKAVSFDAVLSEADKKFVWTVDSSNKLRKKYIDVSLEGDTLTSINTDLPEFVVIPDSSAKNVKEGDSVTFWWQLNLFFP